MIAFKNLILVLYLHLSFAVIHVFTMFTALFRFVFFNHTFRWSKAFEMRISRIGMKKVSQRVLKFIDDHWAEEIVISNTDFPKQKDLVSEIYDASLNNDAEKLAELRKLEYQKIFIRKEQDRKFTTRWSVINF